jgi:hypothetical protein
VHVGRRDLLQSADDAPRLVKMPGVSQRSSQDVTSSLRSMSSRPMCLRTIVDSISGIVAFRRQASLLV